MGDPPKKRHPKIRRVSVSCSQIFQANKASALYAEQMAHVLEVLQENPRESMAPVESQPQSPVPLAALSVLEAWLINTLWCISFGCLDFSFLPTNGCSIKLLKVKLLAGEQKATECTDRF